MQAAQAFPFDKVNLQESVSTRSRYWRQSVMAVWRRWQMLTKEIEQPLKGILGTRGDNLKISLVAIF